MKKYLIILIILSNSYYTIAQDMIVIRPPWDIEAPGAGTHLPIVIGKKIDTVLLRKILEDNSSKTGLMRYRLGLENATICDSFTYDITYHSIYDIMLVSNNHNDTTKSILGRTRFYLIENNRLLQFSTDSEKRIN